METRTYEDLFPSHPNRPQKHAGEKRPNPSKSRCRDLGIFRLGPFGTFASTAAHHAAAT